VVERRIVAMGGGGFSMEPENPRLDAFVLSLARSSPPRVCFVPTASGDSERYVANFYRAFAASECTPSDLGLFDRAVEDLEAFVLAQDVVYVGGGNTASLLAVWRAHGLDAILRRAWAEGVVLCGISAGMNCWFEQSVTDSFGPRLAPLHDGLGLVPGSACPHYDGEERLAARFLDQPG
jgi:peptidase E